MATLEEMIAQRKELDAEEARLEEAVREVQRRRDEHDKTLLPLLTKDLDEQPEEPVIGTAWSCPDNPLGLCVFDEAQDSCHDFCLFCGHPEERK